MHLNKCAIAFFPSRHEERFFFIIRTITTIVIRFFYFFSYAFTYSQENTVGRVDRNIANTYGEMHCVTSPASSAHRISALKASELKMGGGGGDLESFNQRDVFFSPSSFLRRVR